MQINCENFVSYARVTKSEIKITFSFVKTILGILSCE